jgi:hypothetical protein
MNRRQFLAGSAAITGAATLPRAEGRPASSANRIGRNRISAITDEIAMSPEEAIAFAKHFGLEWLELRNTPELPKQGKPYFFLTEEELKPAAKSFRDSGIRISFLNTNLCKNGLPGTLPVRWAKQDAGSQLTSTAAAQKEYDELTNGSRSVSGQPKRFSVPTSAYLHSYGRTIPPPPTTAWQTSSARWRR